MNAPTEGRKDFNGSAPRRAGTKFERQIADYAQAEGLPWDRAPLRGVRDLLDLTGTLPAGFLVGCKAITRGSQMKQRLSEAMDQNVQAVNNLRRLRPVGYRDDTVPVQIMQRSGASTAGHYAVMTYGDFLTVVKRLMAAEARAEHYAAELQRVDRGRP